MEITRRLEALDEFICNNFHAPNINQVLNEFDWSQNWTLNNIH